MADQTKRIIYQNDQRGVTVLIPPHDDDCSYSLEEIAAKDVPPIKTFVSNGSFNVDTETREAFPFGQIVVTPRPYKIVDVSEIPSDRSERQGWSVDVVDLTDGVSE